MKTYHFSFREKLPSALGEVINMHLTDRNSTELSGDSDLEFL